MSEVTPTTPAAPAIGGAGTPESPPPGYEHFPNPEGSEAGAGGSPDLSVGAGGESPGLATTTPEQQVETLPPGAEQVLTPEQQAAVATQQQPIPAKGDEARFEYQQSRADKAENRLADYEASQLHSIAQYIQRTPEMLDIVEEGIRGGPLVKPRGMPERPVRPQRPENYDSSEAHDPETVSGRYRASFDDYLEKKDIYDDAREERRTVQTQRDAAKDEIAELKADLVREGGLTGEQADEFLTMLNSSESRNPVTLAKFYQVLKSPSQDQIANQEKARQLLAKQQGLESPPPLATAGGETPPQLTPEQEMAESMKAHQSTSLRGRLR